MLLPKLLFYHDRIEVKPLSVNLVLRDDQVALQLRGLPVRPARLVRSRSSARVTVGCRRSRS